MTTPMTPAGMPQADQAPMAQPTPPYFAPAPKTSRLGAAVIGGAAVTALLGGAVGGAVGYTVASNNSTPTVAIASSESGSVGANLASATGNTVVDLAAAVQPAVVQLDVSGGSGSGTEPEVASDPATTAAQTSSDVTVLRFTLPGSRHDDNW